MDSTRVYLKCTYCGHVLNIDKEASNAKFITCGWCEKEINAEESKELARKDWQ